MTHSQVCPGPWKKLLVCTDGSPNSQVAVYETLNLARLCGSTVFALQVLQIVPEFEAVAPDLMVRLAEEIRAQMEVIKVKGAATGVTMETCIRSSVSPFRAILEEIERLQPDLVVMGRYGKTGLARLMLGSVTARIAGLSPVNVLVVPLEATGGFSHLLIASDGSPCSAAAFREALAIARRTHAKLVAVSVATRKKETALSKEILKNLGVAAQKCGVKLESEALVGEPDEAIVEAAQKSRAEMIVLGSHGRTGWKRLLLGSVAERVIGRTSCPVLVVKKASEQAR
ncbi:MAG: universal stress protein [Deltaproteobacteria bacterium]|nr:universal stress protein [Deltaproteobacteria bacterium]